MTPSRLVLAAVLVAYLVGNASGLAVYPRVEVDEPWIAAAPYKLATQGVLGSDLFTGLAGMERHHYQHMPVYPVLEAGVFKLFGVGVAQMRLLSVTFGFLVLAVVFMAGRLVGGEPVGATAVLILAALRITEGGEATGILLLDRARINRYDIAVPFFGLLAFLVFVRAERSRRAAGYFAAGMLAALSSLSHLYGGFWMVILVGVLAARHGLDAVRRPAVWWVGLGFAIAWVPWAAFIATGWHDFLGQAHTVPGRFDVFSADFYVTNVLHVDGPVSVDWLVRIVRSLPADRVGSWTALLGLPAAAAAMLAGTRGRPGHPLRLLAVVSLAQLACFVVLLRMKTIDYMVALWPLGALSLAWLGVRLWDTGHRGVRSGLVVLSAALAIEGGGRVAHAQRVARQMTPYSWYTAELSRCIPPGSRVLGLPNYWLGLRQFPFRSWMLPLFQTNPRFTAVPVPFDAALDGIDPDIILIDPFMTDMFEQTRSEADPLHRLWVDYEKFAAQRHLTPACVIRDRTYGATEVYHVGAGGADSGSRSSGR